MYLVTFWISISGCALWKRNLDKLEASRKAQLKIEKIHEENVRRARISSRISKGSEVGSDKRHLSETGLFGKPANFGGNFQSVVEDQASPKQAILPQNSENLNLNFRVNTLAREPTLPGESSPPKDLNASNNLLRSSEGSNPLESSGGK